jgi:hypothetical protein
VQTLTPTIFPCYAAADREAARQIAEFLEKCDDARVFLQEGEMRPGQDLAEKAREARMADIALVLFTRNSLPARWPRTQWEDALVKEPAEERTRIAFLRCDDCVPPRVLKPQFDLVGLPREGLRQLKRWVRGRAASFEGREQAGAQGREGGLEVLGIAVADQPGSETAADPALAEDFAWAYREDFDAVFRVECGDRSLAGAAGDLAATLGLQLEGELEENLSRLRDFCAAQRFLVILAGAQDDTAKRLAFGGRCSTLMVEGAGTPGNDGLQQAQRTLRHAERAGSWAEICAMARQGRRLCQEQGRLAESYELMTQWYAAAEERGDRQAMEESTREMVWILERWGRDEEAERLDYVRITELAQQMTFQW